MRVGTSFDHAQRQLGVWDHPHACGDKNADKVKDFVKVGSSPCVWGQALSDSTADAKPRIIPMRVGTRSAFNRAFAKTWDHPHACGDKTKEIKENSGFAKSTA